MQELYEIQTPYGDFVIIEVYRKEDGTVRRWIEHWVMSGKIKIIEKGGAPSQNLSKMNLKTGVFYEHLS